MSLRQPLAVAAVVIVGLGAGVVYGQGANSMRQPTTSASDAPTNEEDTPNRVPDANERITVVDGRGGERSDMTYQQFLERIEQLEADAPARSGEIQLYGLTTDGEVGVIGVCVQVAVDELDDARHAVLKDAARGLPVAPDHVHDCSPAPGVQWPSQGG